MMMLKFGKKEHLELLKAGVLHFRPLDVFSKDLTSFRGDHLEGKLRYPKNEKLIVNGLDISPYIKEATISCVGFENILSFSLALLDINNCHVIEEDLYTPNDDFICEMQQFGDHFLILPPDMITALKKKLETYNCYWKRQSIFYCDKSDFKTIRNHYIKKNGSVSEYDLHCFTKELSYSKQNEYRFIIHDFENEFPLDKNGGVNIKADFTVEMPIFETSSLRTLRISRCLLE